MKELERRLAKAEHAAAANAGDGDGADPSRAARCRAAADTYQHLLHALVSPGAAADVAAGLPPPTQPVARARAAFAALLRAIAEQGQDQGQDQGQGQSQDDQPTDMPESDRP